MIEDPIVLVFIAIVFGIMVAPMLYLAYLGLVDETHSDLFEVAGDGGENASEE